MKAWAVALVAVLMGTASVGLAEVRDPTRPPEAPTAEPRALEPGVAEPEAPDLRVRMIMGSGEARRAYINGRWYVEGERIEADARGEARIRHIGRTAVDVEFNDTVTRHRVTEGVVEKRRRPGGGGFDLEKRPRRGNRGGGGS